MCVCVCVCVSLSQALSPSLSNVLRTPIQFCLLQLCALLISSWNFPFFAKSTNLRILGLKSWTSLRRVHRKLSRYSNAGWKRLKKGNFFYLILITFYSEELTNLNPQSKHDWWKKKLRENEWIHWLWQFSCRPSLSSRLAYQQLTRTYTNLTRHWNHYKSGQNHLTDFIGVEPSKKRKRRTSFTPQALELLNAHFERNTHPSGE